MSSTKISANSGAFSGVEGKRSRPRASRPIQAAASGTISRSSVRSGRARGSSGSSTMAGIIASNVMRRSMNAAAAIPSPTSPMTAITPSRATARPANRAIPAARKAITASRGILPTLRVCDARDIICICRGNWNGQEQEGAIKIFVNARSVNICASAASAGAFCRRRRVSARVLATRPRL